MGTADANDETTRHDQHAEDPMDTTTGTTTGTTDESGTAEPTTTSAPAATTQATARDDAPRGVRVTTAVWGLVVAAVGLGMLAVALGLAFDVELAFIVLVAAAGVALLVGTLVAGSRRRR